jgi:hypothetical protein
MKNVSGSVSGWLVEERVDTIDNSEKSFDEKEFNKLIKDAKTHFTKFKFNVEQMYDLKKKKEYYDVISLLFGMENLVDDLN